VRTAERFDERPAPSPVVAATPVVPGYVDGAEVARIARFIARQNRNVPYSPQFCMKDLPPTSVSQAKAAERVAREAGLTNVHIGNRFFVCRHR
jgi:pyruvate formate lyase activating enzyme